MKKYLKNCLIVITLSIFSSCGLTDIVEGVNCIADFNDPELLEAYSDALTALSNNPDDPALCQEFEVAADNYIAERAEFARCLRDSALSSVEELEELEEEIANLEAERLEKRC